jgi:hypothetical protein
MYISEGEYILYKEKIETRVELFSWALRTIYILK